MNDMVGAIFAVLGILVPVAVIGSIVYIIISLTKHKDGDKKKAFKISTKSLFQIYLYTLSLITLAAAVIGLSTALRGGLAYQFGHQFSYTLYQANSFKEAKVYDPALIEEDFDECYDGTPKDIEGQTYCINESQPKSDLINGGIVFVSMIILFAVHQYAIYRTEKKLDWLDKMYTFGSLIGYSVTGILSLVISISLLSNYLVFTAYSSAYQTPEAPGMAISLAVLTIPLWIYFMLKTIKLKEEN
jgi:cellobiose-specific phosphotransferase system component IIC